MLSVTPFPKIGPDRGEGDFFHFHLCRHGAYRGKFLSLLHVVAYHDCADAGDLQLAVPVYI